MHTCFVRQSELTAFSFLLKQFKYELLNIQVTFEILCQQNTIHDQNSIDQMPVKPLRWNIGQEDEKE